MAADNNGSTLWKTLAGVSAAIAIAAVVWNYQELLGIEQKLARLEAMSIQPATIEELRARDTVVQAQIASTNAMLAKIDAIQTMNVQRLDRLESWQRKVNEK